MSAMAAVLADMSDDRLSDGWHGAYGRGRIVSSFRRDGAWTAHGPYMAGHNGRVLRNYTDWLKRGWRW
jgi:hypothetical protein